MHSWLNLKHAYLHQLLYYISFIIFLYCPLKITSFFTRKFTEILEETYNKLRIMCFLSFNEEWVIETLKGCPNIIENVFLEYASGGSLADLIKKIGSAFLLPEFVIRNCTLFWLGWSMYMTMDFCIISCHNVLLVPTVNVLDAKVANSGWQRGAMWKVLV